MKPFFNALLMIVCAINPLTVAQPVHGQEIYFNEPVSEQLLKGKLFWKKIYAEIDSSRSVIYHRYTLRIFGIVTNDRVAATLDSLKKVLVDPDKMLVKQGRKEFIRDAITRAGNFPFIDDTLKKYGLHPDLKWLPVLESGYLDTMVSVSGARGIWQFMPATGRKFGLSSSTITNPHMSTVAFARYFSVLLAEFNSYALALSAYNHGENGIRQKLKTRKAKSLVEILPDLGFESRNYYVRFLSVIDIAGNPAPSVTSEKTDSLSYPPEN
jgi:hypothetical protein